MDVLKPREDGKVSDPIFTGEGRGAKRNQVWSKDGIQWFNDLFDKIAVDRAQNEKVDAHYQKKKRL